MTNCDPTDRLSAKQHFVLVLRLGVKVDGQVTGEFVDPLSERRQRFIELACLVDALQGWIDNALNTVHESMSQPMRRRSERTRGTPNRVFR